MGCRQVQPENPALEALVDDCMDLRVKISLLMDAKDRDHASLRKMLQELHALEECISTERSARA